VRGRRGLGVYMDKKPGRVPFSFFLDAVLTANYTGLVLVLLKLLGITMFMFKIGLK
jgi:hypothetical protein